jgi:hypothetical protein
MVFVVAKLCRLRFFSCRFASHVSRLT